jgi:hypothetical protein
MDAANRIVLDVTAKNVETHEKRLRYLPTKRIQKIQKC